MASARACTTLRCFAAVLVSALCLLATGAAACDSFPYVDCDAFAEPGSIYLSQFQIIGQSLSFTVHSLSPDPLAGGTTNCNHQAVDFILINSYSTCTLSNVTAYKSVRGTTIELEKPTFILKNQQQVSLSIRVNTTWTEINSNSPQLTLILGDKPGSRHCNWWQQTFTDPTADPQARSWHVLNSTAVKPIDLVFVSAGNGGGTCCPRPAGAFFNPPPSPSPPVRPSPPLPPCRACGTLAFQVPDTTPLLPLVPQHCADLASLMNSDPVLTGLAPPGSLTFSCSPSFNGSVSPTQISFQACARGDANTTNSYVDTVIAHNLDLYAAVLSSELGLRIQLEPSAPCDYFFLISSSCGNTQSSQGTCPQNHSPPPAPPPAPPGDTSWLFNVTSKEAAVAQATQTVQSVPAVGVGASSEPAMLISSAINKVLTLAKLYSMFVDWCSEFGLASPDDKAAFHNFKRNMVVVFNINLNASIPWWASGNQFSHLNHSQFAATYLGALGPNIAHQRRRTMSSSTDSNSSNSSSPGAGFSFPPITPFPVFSFPGTNPTPAPTPNPTPNSAGVNWVSQGKVTTIRNQGGCGSCWAFVATALVESMYLMTGRGNPGTVNLSEEQLTSCVNPNSSPYNGYGCSGGWIDNAINYVAWNDLVTESVRPYSGSAQDCSSGPSASPSSGNAVKLGSGAQQVSPSSNLAALRNAVLAAPVGVYFMADSTFQNYHGGIYQPTTCTAKINHAVVIVGWGYDGGSSSYYWLVRNSWGTGWGEQGYVRIQMTGDGPGPCGMYQWAYYIRPNSIISSPLTNV